MHLDDFLELNKQTKAYFEGLLCRLTGADDNESRASHAAETFQMQPFQYRHGRHGIVLQRKQQKDHLVIEQSRNDNSLSCSGVNMMSLPLA